MRTVIGLFPNGREARLTLDELRQLGARDSEIGVLTQDDELDDERLSLSPVEVPGIGHANASGPFSTYLSRSTAAGSPDAMISMLTGMGIARADAERYVAGVAHGYTLETARVDDDIAGEALEIMRHHAIDQGRAGMRGVERDDLGRDASDIEGETVLPVIVEELAVGKREVAKGGVRVRSRVEETPVQKEVSLREEKVDVERRKVDRPLSGGEAPFEDKTIEVVARAEEPVVTKNARVVEEVVVRKGETQRSETVRDTVRKTDVDVEDIDVSGYREHYDTNYASRGDASFDRYEPAYRFGHQLRRDRDEDAVEWSSVEGDAQRSWETSSPGTWDRFKDAIRHAWERAKS